MNIKYPDQAQELTRLLAADQVEKKQLARVVFEQPETDYSGQKQELARRTHERSVRVLQILAEIGQPSLSNIGNEAALAMSVLASHDTSILKTVLDAFNELYEADRQNCRYQSIPAMTDAYLVSCRQPQRFGTQWFFDEQNYPFLYFVEDFEQLNDRRAAYGIEPLRWPKSLAIPESDQPWLQRPLTELVMRRPTEVEYARNKA